VGGFSDDGKNKDSRARAVSRGLVGLHNVDRKVIEGIGFSFARRGFPLPGNFLGFGSAGTAL
jgi:hypothetical protein